MALTLGLGSLAAVPVAAAHERVDVADGKYQLVIGWTNEPPYAGYKNGLDLGVNRVLGETGERNEQGDPGLETEPVSGLLDNLTVTYEYAGRTFTPPDWRAQFGRAGWYTAEITPTREGEYTIHVQGEIEGNPVDVKVAPQEVVSAKETMFPEEDLTNEEVTAQIRDLQAEVQALKEENRTTPGPGAALGALAAVGLALVLGKRK